MQSTCHTLPLLLWLAEVSVKDNELRVYAEALDLSGRAAKYFDKVYAGQGLGFNAQGFQLSLVLRVYGVEGLILAATRSWKFSALSSGLTVTACRDHTGRIRTDPFFDAT